VPRVRCGGHCSRPSCSHPSCSYPSCSYPSWPCTVTALPLADDATLARAAASGDSTAFAQIYDRYAYRLLGFCQSMLRTRVDAEDCLQDVFVVAATRLADLREPALLRSWLFSVAGHECLGRIDRRKKEVLLDAVPDRATLDPDSPANAALDAEPATLLRDATAGLSYRDRLLLELADRQRLSGDELAVAIGVPRSAAYTLLARARATAKKSIRALLVARTGRQRCAELNGMLGDWDGELTTLRRKRIAHHIDKCAVCTAHRDRVATPAALLGEGTAFAADLVGLRSRVLVAASAASAGEYVGGGLWVTGWPPVDPEFAGRDHRRWRAPVAALLALLFIGAAGTLGVVLSEQGTSTSLAQTTAGTTTSTSNPTSTSTSTSTSNPPSTTARLSTRPTGGTARVLAPPPPRAQLPKPTAKTRKPPTPTPAPDPTPAPTPIARPTLTATPAPSAPAIWSLSVYSFRAVDDVTVDNLAVAGCALGHSRLPAPIPYGPARSSRSTRTTAPRPSAYRRSALTWWRLSPARRARSR
jgi:RNA polymerase sigma factor (sigma-70 family)